MMSALRVAILDDHRIFRGLLQAAFEDTGGRYTLVGSAERLADLGALFARPAPDVLLVDYELPDGFGTEAVRRMRHHWARTRSLLFTRFPEFSLVDEAAAVGVAGFASKEADLEDLLIAIDVVGSGRVHWSAGVVRTLALAAARRLDDPDRTTPTEVLTGRERQALAAFLEAGDVSGAADLVGVSRPTLRGHLDRAVSKLGVANRNQAIARALHTGLIVIGPAPLFTKAVA